MSTDSPWLSMVYDFCFGILMMWKLEAFSRDHTWSVELGSCPGCTRWAHLLWWCRGVAIPLSPTLLSRNHQLVTRHLLHSQGVWAVRHIQCMFDLWFFNGQWTFQGLTPWSYQGTSVRFYEPKVIMMAPFPLTMSTWGFACCSVLAGWHKDNLLGWAHAPGGRIASLQGKETVLLLAGW